MLDVSCGHEKTNDAVVTRREGAFMYSVLDPIKQAQSPPDLLLPLMVVSVKDSPAVRPPQPPSRGIQRSLVGGLSPLVNHTTVASYSRLGKASQTLALWLSSSSSSSLGLLFSFWALPERAPMPNPEMPRHHPRPAKNAGVPYFSSIVVLLFFELASIRFFVGERGLVYAHFRVPLLPQDKIKLLITRELATETWGYF